MLQGGAGYISILLVLCVSSGAGLSLVDVSLLRNWPAQICVPLFPCLTTGAGLSLVEVKLLWSGPGQM